MATTTDTQAVAVMGLEEVQALIDQATRPDVPLRVLFAALDRLTDLAQAEGCCDGSRAVEDVGGSVPVEAVVPVLGAR
jgi:hypothetical protein